jgi:hypothetical protein
VLDATPGDLDAADTPPPGPTAAVTRAAGPRNPDGSIPRALLPALGPRAASGSQHAGAVPITRPRRRAIRVGPLLTAALLRLLRLIGRAWADGDGKFDWVHRGEGAPPATLTDTALPRAGLPDTGRV